MELHLKTIKRRLLTAAAIGTALALSACASATPEQLQQAAAAKHLTGTEIQAATSGNTLSGKSKEGPMFTEIHLADGSIRGRWNGNEKYTGKWHVEGDKMCQDYDGSDDSDGCSPIALNGDQFYWLKDDGSSAYNADRPTTLAPGNPGGL